ncbi:MAG: FkbM family methyltransferase [Cyanobacteria bacterium SZAS LIN-5]|nr:FkbM family methyltransferase [Cyanobacteria bacterium SZAS LIN-5]
MSNGIVERIKSVKDHILSSLETLKSGQEDIRSRQADLRGQIDVLNAQMHDLAREAKTIEQQHHEQIFGELVPASDRFSYPDGLEDYRRSNPEVALLQYLRSYLPSPNAIDIGANVGDVSAMLLSAGYRVFAFEPMPETFERLRERFEQVQSGFKSFPIAVGAKDGVTSFYALEVPDQELSKTMEPDLSVYSTTVKHAVPEGMNYSEPIDVTVRSLKSLHGSGELPADISILKIDTEGGDLEVIRGMGTAKYAVIVSEFWDAEHYFSNGEFGLMQDTVAHLRARGYNWHIVIYRPAGTAYVEPRFYCNLDQSVRGSWGNAIFFRDYDVFKEALKWCSSMLRANSSFRI